MVSFLFPHFLILQNPDSLVPQKISKGEEKHMLEEDVLYKIAHWIIKNDGKNKIKVLQDQQRNNGLQTFKVKGDQHKPDLLCLNGQNTAIEIKTGDEGNTLGSNSGIVNYFKKYCEGETSYFDEQGRPIKIDNFVLATRYSIEGRLKENEPLHKDRSRKNAAGKYLPEIEYESTYNIFRHGIVQQIDNDRYRNCGVGIGVLLSSKLGFNPSHYNWRNINTVDKIIPAIEIKKPNPNVLGKNGGHRWGFEWRPL